MTTREEVRTAWANEELAQVITQLTALHTEFKENSGLIQHELIEPAIEKLYFFVESSLICFLENKIGKP